MDKEGLKLEIELLEIIPKNKLSEGNVDTSHVDMLFIVPTIEIRRQLDEVVASNYPRCTVRYASDALEAYVQLEHKVADFIICETEMPYMSGFDFMIKLKTEEALKQIPIVLISSQSLHGAIDSYVPIICHPTDFQDLKLRLDEICSKISKGEE